MGSSTAAALLQQGIGNKVTIANRSEETFRAACERRPSLEETTFASVDIDNPSSLLGALKNIDLVVHTGVAGAYVVVFACCECCTM